MEKLLDKSQVSECLGLSVRTVDRLRASGELKFVFVRGRVRFRPEDVLALVFRLQGADETMFSASDLFEGLEVDIDCGSSPTDPRNPVSLWYCGNSDCVVREVKIEAAYLGAIPPKKAPAMLCPECREVMRFGNYIKRELVMPLHHDNHATRDGGPH